ncbi:hypothetical protein RP20_CCG011072 [Aedes albopictus]|nr:hypothetical protein RP20_CCG011072 [Aedes albopictus]
MATIQTSKVALQYGQRFTNATSGPSVPGVMAVAPMQEADRIAQSHPHQQYGSMSGQKEAVILNHVMSNVAPVNVVSSVLSGVDSHAQQGQLHSALPMQPPVPKMWLLVAWETPAGEPNTYSVIDSSELILHSQSGSTRETIHTGKTIFVRRGKKIQQATVVIISDDKQFIDTEVRQLRKMAAENLYRNTVVPQGQHNVAVNQEQQVKRRRIEPSAPPADEHEPASPEYEPMPTHSQLATANWVNSCKNERIMSPSPSVMSVQVNNPASFSKPPPPMTFDQQTQTDTRYFPQDGGNQTNQPELTKILSLLETIVSEQKIVRMETEYNRKLTYDMMEQQSTFSETLKNLVSKVDVVNKFEITEVMKNPDDNVSSYVVLGTGGEESQERESSIAESTAYKPSASNGSPNLMIEHVNAQEESNLSFSQSKFAIHEESSVNSATSTPKNLNFTNKLSSSALSLSNVSIQSHASNNPPSNTKMSAVTEMLKDWNDDDGGDEAELTTIGPNNTMVKKQILRAINWTNYKAATRKLLMTLFSREVLASHTLTGRPSPAFMGDRAKPVKDKLDQRIIADIIAIVAKRCNVSEPMVRTAITTKCADENKMSRMKQYKSGSNISVGGRQYAGQDAGGGAMHSSTSDIDTSLSMDATQTAPPYARRVKRENKENVH